MAADMAAPAHRKPTLIVDNYDSYTHNLYQMCWSVSGVQPILIRNDEEARFQSLLGRAAFDNIIISPGPGSPDRPQDFGICARILKSPPAPVLGVCLGCQGLGWMYGLDVCKAPGGAVHGRKSAVFHNEAERGGGGLFAGIPDGFHVVRYHSLAVVPRPGMPFPEELERTAWTADGVLMGLQHRKLPLWGVQFHPESICTEYGAELLGNFLALADAHNATLEATHSNASTPPSAQPHALESSHGWAYTEESPLRVSSSGSSGASSCGSAGAGATAPMGAGGCDFHGAARGAHEPETCAAASRPLQAATCPPPGCGHRKLKLLHRVLETRLEAETFYMANLSQDERSFWLDSSRREHGVARFSYMGGSTGPLSYQLRYDLPNRTLETTFPSGRKELRDKCDVLEFLEGQLQACKHSGGAAELPFEFRGGFVGYLGYELKELCEDGQGQRNRHISQEPDAVLLFADRFLVWDHQEGHVYVAALVSDGAVAEAEARAWLACTEQEVRRLSSLSLKDTLAARHQAMRDPPPLPVNARGGAVAAEGVAASAQGMSMPAGGQGILVQPLQVGAASGEEQDLQDLASHDMMEDDAPSNEPPTVDADDGEEQEPSHTPAGPGALSFPPVSPTAPSLSAGPGSVPRGAMPHADSEGGKDAVAAASALSSRESGFVSLDSARQYQDKVQQCLGHIVEGESYELCLTTRLRSRRGMRLDPLRFYQRLRAVNPAPYSALLRCGKGLTVCSSSPERFMRISAQGLCDSKPIKGTRRRGSCPEEDAEICRELRKCEKDLAENLMIVDLVRNDLGRVCTQASVCCPKIMDVETYATVHQLVSTIQGQMRPELSRVDVLRATFPMGSMTGAPKRRSLALLDELESDARGIYSGAIGFLSLDGAVHLSVAIRTAVVTDDGVKVGAGGAVTVLSDPEDEWEEMQLKASALVNCAHAVCMSVPAADLAAGAPVA